MSEEYVKILEEGDLEQTRLVVSEFRGKEYLHIRKYYLDFSGEWLPTNKGVSMELSIPLVQNLFGGIIGMLAKAESKSILEEHFPELLEQVYK